MAAHKTSEFQTLFSILIVFIILESMVSIDARELRPSDHGLEYYYEPAESSEMTSFFGPPELTSSSSPSVSTLPSAALKSPKTSSIVDRGGRDDHLTSHVFFVASLVCGLSGVALMVASALIYFLGSRKKQTSSSDCDQTNASTK